MLKVMIAPVTPFQQNCSIVWCDETMEGTAVDPGGDFDMLKEAIAQHDTSARLGEIDAPTLVIHGSEDRMLPCANGEAIARQNFNRQQAIAQRHCAAPSGDCLGAPGAAARRTLLAVSAASSTVASWRAG